MGFTSDVKKSESNFALRGLSFELAAELDWQTAIVREDTRKDYGEIRLFVLGKIRDRLHALVLTPRGEDLRVISLRKANGREEKLYEIEQA